jgi:general secretion pathway protein I
MLFEQGARRPQQGFTLLEVMIALAIVALGVIGLFNQIIRISDGTLRMRERTMANWIALNEITRIRLSGSMPEVSEFDGDVEFAGAEYRWQARVSETGVEDLRRIDIEVGYVDDPDVSLGNAVGFVTPAPSGNATLTDWSGGSRNLQPGPAGETDEPTPQDQAPE